MTLFHQGVDSGSLVSSGKNNNCVNLKVKFPACAIFCFMNIEILISLKPIHSIYPLKMYQFSKQLTFEYRFPCHADNPAYPHDGSADKCYRRDRCADS